MSESLLIFDNNKIIIIYKELFYIIHFKNILIHKHTALRSIYVTEKS